MLRSFKELTGFRLLAPNGPCGRVHDLYFHDQQWHIQYFVIRTGGWLAGWLRCRWVLLTPDVIGEPDDKNCVLPVSLTRQQVYASPTIEAHPPVSRQHEMEIANQQALLAIHEEDSIPTGSFGVMMGPPIAKSPPELEWEAELQEVVEITPFDAMLSHSDHEDSHLRSMHEVLGYGISIVGHELGSVHDLIMDDRTWAIEQVLARTHDNQVCQHFIVPPECIHAIKWEAAAVEIAVPPDVAKETPRAEVAPPLLQIAKTPSPHVFSPPRHQAEALSRS